MAAADTETSGFAARLRSLVLAPILAPLRTAWNLVPNWAKDNWLTRTVLETIRLVRANRVMGIAAEVSFWGVLSVTPLLLVSASTLGWIDSLFGLGVADDVRSAMSSFVSDLLGIGDQAVSAIDTLFDNPDPAGLTIGILTSFYASSRGFTSLIGGIDHITGRERKRNWVTTRIAGFVAAILSVPGTGCRAGHGQHRTYGLRPASAVERHRRGVDVACDRGRADDLRPVAPARFTGPAHTDRQRPARRCGHRHHLARRLVGR